MTPKQFVEENPKGYYVLCLANHLSSAVDGYYYDTWDCGDQCVYGYFKTK